MPPFSSVVGVEWYNQNSLRKYPLADDASGTDVTNTFNLPHSLIVDLVIPISSATQYDPDGFVLREVAVFGLGIVVTFAYTADNSTFTEVGRISVSSTHTPNTTYFMYGTGAFSDVIARVTIGDIQETLATAGVFTFDRAGGRLVSTVIRPDIRGVSRLRVRNGGDVSDPIYGVVELVAGTNMTITVSGNQITFNAIDGANLNQDCGCLSTADRTQAPCIRRINGQQANSQGNIQFTGVNCITVQTGNNALTIKDVCSEPCCTVEDINKIISDLNSLTTDVRTQGFAQQKLENNLQQMQALANAIAATGFILT